MATKRKAAGVATPAAHASHLCTFDCAYRRGEPQASETTKPRTFDDILTDSTRHDLLVMVELHRRYLGHKPIPKKLQRTVGRAWMNRSGVRP